MSWSFFDSLHRSFADNGSIFGGGNNDNDNKGEAVEQSETTSLCQSCANLFHDGVCFASTYQADRSCPPAAKIPRCHLSWALLQKSAKDGCRLCNVIEFEIRRAALPKDDSVLWVQCERESYETNQMVWGIEVKDPGVEEKNNTLFENQTQSRTQLKLSAGDRVTDLTVISASTGSAEALDTLKEWIRDCDQYHTKCRASQAESLSLPTRLLDLTRVPTNGVIQLTNGADLLPGTRYLTLSHRWGAVEATKLEKSNYDQFYSGFSLSLLPQLFRDACNLAVDLGIEYIWIDSLCVVQDSVDEWLSEGTKMAVVYSNAYLNIAANSAGSSSDQLFSDRNPLAITPCQVNTSCTCSPTAPWKVASERGHWTQGSLDARGWVVQELLLPSRVATFGKCKIEWTCNTQKCDELRPKANFLTGMYDMDGGWRKAANQKVRMDAPTESVIKGLFTATEFALSPLINWQRVIGWKYTIADLTFQKDKLIAISGIARKTFERSDETLGRYVAGLWTTRIDTQLMWKANGSTCSRQEQYQAPSWSWASIRGPIAWNSDDGAGNQELDSEVLDVWTTVIGDDPYGPVSDGCLTMAAELCKIGLVNIKYKGFNHGTNNLRFTAGNFVELDQELLATNDFNMAQSEYQDHPTFVKKTNRDEEYNLGIIPDDQREWTAMRTSNYERILYVMLLVHKPQHYQGLVLAPVSKDGTRGRYRRVGKVEPVEYDMGNVFWEACKASKLDETRYRSLDSKGRYVIEIV